MKAKKLAAAVCFQSARLKVPAATPDAAENKWVHHYPCHSSLQATVPGCSVPRPEIHLHPVPFLGLQLQLQLPISHPKPHTISPLLSRSHAPNGLAAVTEQDAPISFSPCSSVVSFLVSFLSPCRVCRRLPRAAQPPSSTPIRPPRQLQLPLQHHRLRV